MADGMTQPAHDRLRQLAEAVIALILAANLSNKADVKRLLAEIREEVTVAYDEIAATSEANLSGLADIEARFVVQAVNRAMEAQRMRTPRLTTTPAVGGMALARWWKAQADDTLFKLLAAVREAETTEEAAAATHAPMTTAARYAESLTHTVLQRTAMDARTATIKVNSNVINGFQIAETLDSRTCAQCLAYDGSTYDLDENPTGHTILPFNGGPPYHFFCRGITVPVIGEPGKKLSAEDWLNAKTAAQQDDILGKGRAALYRKGVLTLSDLVSGTGKQLSLADLSKKYNTNA
jgi:SPP1 gp7 family putative phage head morphogenesis protein